MYLKIKINISTKFIIRKNITRLYTIYNIKITLFLSDYIIIINV